MAWPFTTAGQEILDGYRPTAVIVGQVWHGPTFLADVSEAITGGQVVEDETAQVRRNCTITLIPQITPTDTLVPGTVGDLLHPGSGNELHLFRGIRYTKVVVATVETIGTGGTGSGSMDAGTTFDEDIAWDASVTPVTGGAFDEDTSWDAETDWDTAESTDIILETVVTEDVFTELAPQGVFRMAPTSTDDDTTLQITITGQDRSASISSRIWTGPFTGAAGLTVDNAIMAILADRWGAGLTYNLTPTTVVVPATTILGVTFDSNGVTSEPGSNSGNDPWADCVTLATSAGCEVFFDRLGTVTLRPISDPTTVPITAQFVEGPGCRMGQLGRTFDPTTMCNSVQIVGTGATVTNSDGSTSPGAAVVGWAYTTDLDNLATFGTVPRQVVDSTISTQLEADTAAQAMLPLVENALDETSLLVSPINPTIDAGDAVFVKRDRMKVLGNIYMTSVVTTPLDDTTPQQQITNRAVAVAVTDA